MRKAYLYLIILLISCVLLYGIFIVVNDIMELQAELDTLYWVSENTHSFMVGIFIEEAELLLQQRTTTLVILVASLVIFIVGGVYYNTISKHASYVPTIAVCYCCSCFY